MKQSSFLVWSGQSPTAASLCRLYSVAFWIKSATWYETFLLDLRKTFLSAVQHGPEVLGEQLGFWWSAQPRWALDVLGWWSPWTCIWPYGIQLYGLLSWCSGSTSLWSLPAIHRARDGAPRWRSSLGPVRPVIAGDTAPKDVSELPQGGRREEGRRVSAIQGTHRNPYPRNCCQNCSECFWEWNWPTVSWLVAVTLRASDLWQTANKIALHLRYCLRFFLFPPAQDEFYIDAPFKSSQAFSHGTAYPWVNTKIQKVRLSMRVAKA